MTRAPITATGAEELKAELKQLKTVERPRITQDIAIAREHGDLKENAEYHAAREEQGFNEGRIKRLEGLLSTAQIIDVPSLAAVVTYHIVGDIESDIKQNKIAISSPIARALIAKEEGDVAAVIAPGGTREYEIVAVTYN